MPTKNSILTLIIIYVFLVLGIAMANDAIQRDALTLLAEARQLETGKVYESGKPSELSKAYIALEKEKNSLYLFNQLFQKSSSNVGKIYALMGIYQKNKKQFKSLSHSLDPKQKIPTLWFDLKIEYKVQELLEKIENGSLYRIVMDIGADFSPDNKKRENSSDGVRKFQMKMQTKCSVAPENINSVVLRRHLGSIYSLIEPQTIIVGHFRKSGEVNYAVGVNAPEGSALLMLECTGVQI